MATGVSSSCDGAAGPSSNGGDSSSRGCRKQAVRLLYDSLWHSSSSDDDDNDRGDIFFGTDDITEFRDLMYKEDVMEACRREYAMKSSSKKKKRESSLFLCFQFLKALCCIPRRDP